MPRVWQQALPFLGASTFVVVIVSGNGSASRRHGRRRPGTCVSSSAELRSLLDEGGAPAWGWRQGRGDDLGDWLNADTFSLPGPGRLAATVSGKPWIEFNKEKETVVLNGLTGTVAVTAQC